MPQRPRPRVYSVHHASVLRQKRLFGLATFVVIILYLYIFWLRPAFARRVGNTVNNAVESSQLQSIKQPVRVGIQSGHWHTDELPEELENLWWNFGASANGVNEWEINLAIAEKTADILRNAGIVVDVLPATISPDYVADAFVSIHADGNDDNTVSGYKVAPSYWQSDGSAAELSESISQEYAKVSGLEFDPNVTEDMTQYYAFNYSKFTHTIAETTPAVLLELGFITNVHDRRMMLNRQAALAQAIADGILHFLQARGKLE